MKRTVLVLLVIAAIAVACGEAAGSRNGPTPAPSRDDPRFTPSPGRQPATPPAPGPDTPAASASAAPPFRPPPAVSTPTPFVPPPNVDLVPAPIDRLDLVVRESFPLQYALQIAAGLPNGCARTAFHDLSRQGRTITLRVLNTQPRNAVCTQIYGQYELRVNLGSDFERGQTYTVNVNDKTLTFTAQ